MSQLSDTQRAVLAAAARRKDGSILPLPASLKGGAATKVVDALIGRGLAERLNGKRSGDERVRITPAGRDAVGAGGDDGAAKIRQRSAKSKADGSPDPAAEGKKRKPRADSKQAQALALLRSARGATVPELQEALGWLPHTVRGFLAGAVKKRLGLTLTSEKAESRGRVYKIPAES